MKRNFQTGLNIANMPIRITADNINYICYIKDSLKEYSATAKKPYFRIHIDTPHTQQRVFRESAIEVVRQNGRFILTDRRKPRQLLGFVDKKKKLCRLSLKHESCRVLFHPFLLSASSLFLSELNGFMLHAAGVIHNGHAYIFIGPSGSGKSTVASILEKKGFEVISDEKIIIRKASSCFMAYAAPWFNNKNQQSVIKNILFLKKSNKVEFKPLGSYYAIKRIFPNIHLNLLDQAAAKGILDTLHTLFKSTAVYEMQFLKDDSFWQKLHNLN